MKVFIDPCPKTNVAEEIIKTVVIIVSIILAKPRI